MRMETIKTKMASEEHHIVDNRSLKPKLDVPGNFVVMTDSKNNLVSGFAARKRVQ